MRKLTDSPRLQKSNRNERGNDVGVKPGRHLSRPSLVRRLLTAGAAAIIAAGSATAAAAAISGTDTGTAPDESSRAELLAEGIVADGIAAEYRWDAVETMTSILPQEEEEDDEQAPPEDSGEVTEPEAEKAAPAVDRDAAPVAGINATQMANAVTIIETGMERGLGERAWAVALATAMQEAKLYNAANPVVPESFDHDWEVEYSDHDSIGIFQQRPSMGWGTVAELMDPATSASKFYGTLENVSGWESMSIAGAAQAVQISAYPDYYAQWEDLAWSIIEAAVN